MARNANPCRCGLTCSTTPQRGSAGVTAEADRLSWRLPFLPMRSATTTWPSACTRPSKGNGGGSRPSRSRPSSKSSSRRLPQQPLRRTAQPVRRPAGHLYQREDLMPRKSISGFTEAGASMAQQLDDNDLLNLFSAVGRVVSKRFLMKRPCLDRWQLVLDYLASAIGFEPREQFRVLYLDKRNHLIADEVMHEGTVDHTPVDR